MFVKTLNPLAPPLAPYISEVNSFCYFVAALPHFMPFVGGSFFSFWGENMIKYTQNNVSNKILWCLYIKGLTSRWYYDNNNIIFGYIF
jgi:hypothetical protein